MEKAGIAQLVEHNLAKVGVASSNLVSRSNILKASVMPRFFLGETVKWRGGRVVMQRTATPLTPVRFRPAPPITDPHGR